VAEETTSLQVLFQAQTNQIDAAFSKLYANISKLDSSLTSTKNNTNMVGKAVESTTDKFVKWLAVGIGVHELSSLVKELESSFISVAESITKVTNKAAGLQVNASAFKTLIDAAQLSGVEMDSVSMIVKMLSVNIGKLGQGDEQAVKSFKTLGLTFKDLQGLDIDKQFLKVEAALGKVTDKNIAAATAQSIMGRGAVAALTLVKTNIAETIEEYDKLGLKLTDTQRAATKEFEDAKIKLGKIYEGFEEKVVAETSPAFTKILNFIEETIKNMGGIDAAAKSFSDAIVSATQVAIKSLGALLDTLQSVQTYFLYVQKTKLESNLSNAQLDQQADTELGQTALDNSSNLNATLGLSSGKQSYVPNISLQFDAMAAREGLLKNDAASNALDKSKLKRDDLVQGLSDSLSTPMTNLQLAMQTSFPSFADALKAQTDATKLQTDAALKLNSTLEDQIKALGKSELSKIVGLTDKEGKAISEPKLSSNFQNAVRDIYKSTITGKQIDLSSLTTSGDGQYDMGSQLDYSKLKSLKNGQVSSADALTALQDHYGQNAAGSTDQVSTLAQIGVLNELKAMVDKVNPQTQRVDLNIKVETAAGFNLSIAQSKEVTDASSKAAADTIVNLLAQSAASVAK
jgi:hypothetical protein